MRLEIKKNDSKSVTIILDEKKCTTMKNTIEHIQQKLQNELGYCTGLESGPIMLEGDRN